MSAIQLYSGSNYAQAAIDALQLQERRIAVYSIPNDENPRVGSLTGRDSKILCQNIAARAVARTGHESKSGEALSSQLTLINEDLKLYFSGLTVKEVYLALDNGLNGMYKNKPEDFVHFSPSNLVQWLTKYIEVTKTPVIHKLLQLQQVEEKKVEEDVPSEYEMLTNQYRRLIDAVVSKSENNTTFEDHGGLVYEFLIGLDLMRPVDLQGEQMDQASMIMLNKAIDSGERSRIRSAKNIADLVLHGGYNEGVFATARRKATVEKIAEIAGWTEDEIIDYLEMVKFRLIDYMSENKIVAPLKLT